MLTFRVEMQPSSLTNEADALFCAAQYCRALPLYQQHINEMHSQTAPSPLHLLSSARSYRMLAKCYRYMGQWDYALPALHDALQCIELSCDCDISQPEGGDSSDNDSDYSCALQLHQHVHHMLADTYSVLAEQQSSNVSNPMRLSRALYHCLVADQLASRLLDVGVERGEGGDEYVAAVDASVAVQVSLGCVYRLMGQQAQQQLRRKRTHISHTEPITCNAVAQEVGALGQLRWQRHDIWNLQWLSVVELEEVVAEWFCEAKAVLNGAIRPLQSFRAHHLLVAICDELHKLYEARAQTA